MRMCSLRAIANKKEFNHFFKSRSSDIVLLKVGNLHQNAKRYEARNTERVARSATTTRSRAPGALILASEASCARSARWECASEASRFFILKLYDLIIIILFFFLFFTFSSEKVLDLCKMWHPPHFCQMSTFWDPLNPKKWFLRMCLSVCLSVCRFLVC